LGGHVIDHVTQAPLAATWPIKQSRCVTTQSRTNSRNKYLRN